MRVVVSYHAVSRYRQRVSRYGSAVGAITRAYHRGSRTCDLPGGRYLLRSPDLVEAALVCVDEDGHAVVITVLSDDEVIGMDLPESVWMRVRPLLEAIERVMGA